jgi:hypothetical protein
LQHANERPIVSRPFDPRIEAYETSGLSCPRFAAMHGVNYQTLVSWLKKRRQADPDHPALRSLVPAELDSISPRSASGSGASR